VRPRLFIPGWGGSGAGHWQTLWQGRMRGARRVEMPDWLAPDREVWVATPVLIAHSLGALTVAWWAAGGPRSVAAAMLVAPPALDGDEIAMPLRSFAPPPISRLPFRSVVVASTDDVYATAEQSAAIAQRWGSDLILVPGAGHLNTASGHGEWPEGIAMLRHLVAE
jgi:uncharacterized protein